MTFLGHPVFVRGFADAPSPPPAPTWLVIGRGDSQTPLGAGSVCDPFTARASPPNLIFNGNFSTFTFLIFHLTILTRGL